MAKQILGKVKLQLKAGQATPAPPVGPALGQYGVNIPGFCKQFNDITKKDQGLIIPAEVTIYKDRSFKFIVKTPPAAILLKKEVGLAKGSPTSHTEKVGSVTEEQLEKIAKIKMKDLNASDMEAAKRMIAGTARSMGITIQKKG
ncbi:MAG: 50S ribosomal protein L11 [Candidatus Cloacimonadota bacterium]|nr:50S ribosomal protein L11 [Candidatus Cloacimonadota bacterium]